MSEAQPLLLQVCPNDHPPFADICRFHAAAAATLGWQTVTIVLRGPAGVPDPDVHYAGGGFDATVAAALDGREPVLTLCHRYRAYRALVTARRVAAPVVAVAHEFGFFRRRQRRWRRHWDRLRGRVPVAFAGVSDPVADELAQVTGSRLLLPNGIDLARSDAGRVPREAATARLHLPESGFNVGVVGRLHPKKNPSLAAAGFAAVADRMPEARLTFVGDGELRDEVAVAAKGRTVKLAGFVPDAAALMPAFDLLLMPSGEREAFGMVALEAMAAGVPVLCGPSPGPRFVVGDTGQHFSTATAADVGAALLSSYREWCSGELQARSRRARARVEAEFSVPAAAGRLQALAVTQ